MEVASILDTFLYLPESTSLIWNIPSNNTDICFIYV
jgi:hypothetical protein